MSTAYDGVLKWASKEAWAERTERVLGDHFGPVWDPLGANDAEDLVERLGAETYAIVEGAAFEDLLSRVWEDGANLVDDYLKRRGLKETATSRDLLSAYRGAFMSLWEIVEVRDAAAVLVLDLVRGGEPVWVELGDADVFEPGVQLGARLLRTRRGLRFGLTVLPFDPDDTGVLLSFFKAQIVEAREADGCDDAEARRRALAANPSLITMEWLADRSEAPEGDEDATSDDDGPVFTVNWPLEPGASEEAVRAAFRGQPAIQILAEASWLLLDLTNSGSEGQGPEALIGPVMLTDTDILLSVLTLEQAQDGIALLAPLLAGLVGTPTITESLDETASPFEDAE